MAAGGGKRESRGKEMDVTGRGCAGGGARGGGHEGGTGDGDPEGPRDARPGWADGGRYHRGEVRCLAGGMERKASKRRRF